MFWRSHWTFRYAWCRVVAQVDAWLNPRAPWIPRSARKHLEQIVSRDMTGIEWGSGRSTVWLAGRVKHITSIEDVESWFELVRGEIETKALDNIDLVLAAGPGGDQGGGASRSSYVSAGTREARSLDFALVDGHSRSACVSRAIDLLGPGGVLVLDDSNRYLPTDAEVPVRCARAQGPWIEIEQCLASWSRHRFSDGVKETSFWTKPSMPERGR